MNLTIKALGIEPFSISNEIPEGLSGYYIPDTKVLCAVATFGKFMIQLVDLGEYSWLYYIFMIKEEITFLLTYSAPLILVRIILKGNFSYEIEFLGNVPLGENQCNVICLPTPLNKLHFCPGEYILFETLYSSSSILQTLIYFPMFEDFKANITAYKPALLCMPHIKPSASVIECVYKIIHSPFSENVRQFHIKSIKDLLIHILEATSHSKPVNIGLLLMSLKEYMQHKLL
ncbi:hypothetical protein [Parafilimonas sp.]|uniref:hypothetical protein n=1 Tax=Parafilimonas sp. TaxID=1969739 RepID=UPI003F7FC60C